VDPHPPRPILFGGEQINPQNTPLKSLGLLIGKNLKFEEYSKRICDRIRTIKTQVDRTFANKSEEILEKIDNIYIQPRILYCSQIYHSGLDHLVKLIEKAIKNYWKLNQTKEPPKDYMWPRLRLILTDLILVHKMYHGKSIMEFESIFKTHDLTSISQGPGGQKLATISQMEASDSKKQIFLPNPSILEFSSGEYQRDESQKVQN
jgi:hypothetical protein